MTDSGTPDGGDADEDARRLSQPRPAGEQRPEKRRRWERAPSGDRPAKPPTDRLAIWALVAGIGSLYFFLVIPSILVFVIAPLAIVLGRRAWRRIDGAEGELGGRGFARFGFFAGIITTAMVVIWLIAILVSDYPDKEGIPEDQVPTATTVPAGDDGAGEDGAEPGPTTAPD